MSELHIAVVEDDQDLAEELGFLLQHHGMKVSLLADGVALEKFLATASCDVLLLDIGLPGEDGLSIARRLAHRADFRVVMLTARSGVDDRVSGFEAGADVYLSKPVNFLELLSVIHRLAKRLPDSRTEWVLHESDARLIAPNQIAISLTTQEVQLLGMMARAENFQASRELIERNLWGDSDFYTSRRLDVVVNRLRSKIVKNIANDSPIQTHWRSGYSFSGKLTLAK